MTVDCEKTVSLRGLALEHLSGPLGNIFPYGKATIDVQLLANLSFYREGKVLKLDDIIQAEDTVMVMLAIAGG